MPTDNPSFPNQSAIHQLIYFAIIVLGILTILYFSMRLALRLLGRKRLAGQKSVFFELSPPAHRDKTPLATEQLFTILHGHAPTRPLFEGLLLRKVLLSLEVVSTKSEGIRYIARVAQRDSDTFRHNITSYLPDIRLKEIEDYLPKVLGGLTQTVSFRQSGHFAYPLSTHDNLRQHDPIAYITGAMTQLEPSEIMAFQIVASPVSTRRAALIEKQLANNQSKILKLRRRWGSSKILKLGGLLMMLPLYYFRGLITTLLFNNELPSSTSSRSYRLSSPTEIMLSDSIYRKLSQPLFLLDIRVLVSANSQSKIRQRTNAFKQVLASYSNHGRQSLKPYNNLLTTKSHSQSAFIKRLPSLLYNNSSILSATELAGLYHFPDSASARTENVVKSLSRTLPAPVSLKNDHKMDVLLGLNRHHGSETPIGLTEAERDRHVYIIGGTGNGKTTMLMYSIVQDIKNGKGLAVVDPHGDLAEALLRHIPKERFNDVLYFNPMDIAFPIGLNLLELPAGLSQDELLIEKDLVTESVISVFRKIFSDDDSGGHRIEYVLRNAIHTAFTIPNATIFTVFKLLTDIKYRKKVTNQLEDEFLKNFWQNEIGKAGEFQRVKMSAGITAKVGRFRFNESAKRIMEQPKSTIDFGDILDSSKILICNFSKGNLGEDTSALFGVATLAKLQLAALRRARTELFKRQPFYVYVDEFQNFATMSFVQLLSEARKYKLFLTMAEQSTSQQEVWRMVNIILANVGTVICFRSGSPTDEEFILPLFSPYIERGEIANLPAYNFYMRIAALQAQEPLSGHTVLLSKAGSLETAKQVIEASRANHAIKYIPPEFNRVQVNQKVSGKKSGPPSPRNTVDPYNAKTIRVA